MCTTVTVKRVVEVVAREARESVVGVDVVSLFWPTLFAPVGEFCVCCVWSLAVCRVWRIRERGCTGHVSPSPECLCVCVPDNQGTRQTERRVRERDVRPGDRTMGWMGAAVSPVCARVSPPPPPPHAMLLPSISGCRRCRRPSHTNSQQQKQQQESERQTRAHSD